jgi:hypothetical protein
MYSDARAVIDEKFANHKLSGTPLIATARMFFSGPGKPNSVTWQTPLITVTMVMLLKDALNFYILLCGNNALKEKTVNSSMACYVHVLPNNTAKQMFVC